VNRALLLVAISLVLSSSAAEAADPRAMQLTYEPWAKVCLQKSDCFIAAGSRGTCFPSGGMIAVNVASGKSASLSVTLATRRKLEGAIRLQIDQEPPILIPYVQCYPTGCSGKLEIDDRLIEQLQASRVIRVETTSQPTMNLSFSLTGFADAYNGPGSEPKAYEKILTREQMNERIKQSEERRPPECDD
jgi:invasion protein IalB